MYEVIVTEDFINVIKELPLRYIGVLTNSFLSIKKVDEKSLALKENAFMIDLLEKIKNQELE